MNKLNRDSKPVRHRAPVTPRAVNDNVPTSTCKPLLVNSHLILAQNLHGGPFSLLLLTHSFWQEHYGPHVAPDFQVLRRYNSVRLANEATAALAPVPTPLRAPVIVAFSHYLVETPSLWSERKAVLQESQEVATDIAKAGGRPHDAAWLAEIAYDYRMHLATQGRGIGRRVILHAIALPLPDDAPALIVVSAQEIVDALTAVNKTPRRYLRA